MGAQFNHYGVTDGDVLRTLHPHPLFPLLLPFPCFTDNTTHLHSSSSQPLPCVRTRRTQPFPLLPLRVGSLCLLLLLLTFILRAALHVGTPPPPLLRYTAGFRNRMHVYPSSSYSYSVGVRSLLYTEGVLSLLYTVGVRSTLFYAVGVRTHIRVHAIILSLYFCSFARLLY
jgi:hypothetical protein